MIWNAFIALTQIGFLLMMGRLFCTAPDNLQKWGVMFPIVIGSLILLAYHGHLAVDMIEEDTAILATGLLIQNFGVCVMVTRLFLKEIGLCKSYSERSRNSTAC